MAIYTFSAFNYGHKVTEDNQNIDFTENGIDVLTAIIPVNSYTLGDFVNAVSIAMNQVGGQDYTISLDRSTRKISISAPSNFDLLVSSGPTVNISAYNLLGFTLGDQAGSNSYEGDSASGSQYSVQFLLQDFVDFQDEQRKAESSVTETASGQVQVTSYGQIKLMSCNITLATDIPDQVAIRENPTGVADLRALMEYLTDKNPIEFLPDENNITFVKCLLEKTPESSDGTGFKLKELYGRNLTGYFETGNLQFREINF